MTRTRQALGGERIVDTAGLYRRLHLRYTCCSEGINGRCQRRIGKARRSHIRRLVDELRVQIDISPNNVQVQNILRTLATAKLCHRHRSPHLDRMVASWIARLGRQECGTQLDHELDQGINNSSNPVCITTAESQAPSISEPAAQGEYYPEAELQDTDERIRYDLAEDSGLASSPEDAFVSPENAEILEPDDHDEAASELPAELDAHLSQTIPSEIDIPLPPQIDDNSSSSSDEELVVLTPTASDTGSPPRAAVPEAEEDPERCYVCRRQMRRSESDTFRCPCGRVGHAVHILWHHWNTSSAWGPLWQCPACDTTMIPPGHHFEEAAA